MKTRACQSGSDMPPGILWKLHHGNRAYNFNTTVNDPMDSCKNTPRPTQSLQDGCACCVCCACVPTAMRPGSSPSGTSTPATIAFSASQGFSTNRGRLPCRALSEQGSLLPKEPHRCRSPGLHPRGGPTATPAADHRTLQRQDPGNRTDSNHLVLSLWQEKRQGPTGAWQD